ncbi:MAG: putative toxin-antitoxin system toxin component, PIN family [Defluviitaleaceae bacterium]|nr:putative toxin-antitoxin system toxin component, PIN family [Defluviitaleaceae bacterium]
MCRIVIDTNVIVSAFKSPGGNPDKIICNATASGSKLKICYDTEIFEEYSDVLNRPKFDFDDVRLKRFFNTVNENGVFCQPQKSQFYMVDETDRCFYDVAKHCGAWLITGNTKHYPKEPFIIAPTDFLRLDLGY